MRRLVLGIAVLAGCGAGAAGPAGSPIDGFWRAGVEHELTLSAGRYEAGDRDAVGICRTVGDYLLEGATVKLHLDSAGCAGAPDGLTVDGERLLGGDRIYERADPAAVIHIFPASLDAL